MPGGAPAPHPPGPRLEAAGLACGYGSARPLLRGVDLAVEAGCTVVVVGPSGCGKTTLLRTVLGRLAPLGGSVRVLDRPPPGPRGSVGYIPQGLGLVRHASALQNVLVGTLPQMGAWKSLAGAFDAAAVEAARDALDAVGIRHKAATRVARLSGGERRRVAIARAFVQRPALLLADEILSELDVRTADAVLDAVRVLQRGTGMGILMVEHDLDVAWSVADRLLCLDRGGVAARFAPPEDAPERLKGVYARAP